MGSDKGDLSQRISQCYFLFVCLKFCVWTIAASPSAVGAKFNNSHRDRGACSGKMGPRGQGRRCIKGGPLPVVGLGFDTGGQSADS